MPVSVVALLVRLCFIGEQTAIVTVSPFMNK